MVVQLCTAVELVCHQVGDAAYYQLGLLWTIPMLSIGLLGYRVEQSCKIHRYTGIYMHVPYWITGDIPAYNTPSELSRFRCMARRLQAIVLVDLLLVGIL